MLNLPPAQAPPVRFCRLGYHLRCSIVTSACPLGSPFRAFCHQQAQCLALLIADACSAPLLPNLCALQDLRSARTIKRTMALLSCPARVGILSPNACQYSQGLPSCVGRPFSQQRPSPGLPRPKPPPTVIVKAVPSLATLIALACVMVLPSQLAPLQDSHSTPFYKSLPPSVLAGLAWLGEVA